MEPRIEIIKAKILVGLKRKTTLSENKSFELWQEFMQIIKRIDNSFENKYYSVQVYNQSLEFKDFDPETEFENWAAVEVTEKTKNLPDPECHTLSGGKYAVFIHTGTHEMFYKTSKYIFGIWLPKSNCKLDNRPHFEILSKNYDPNNPESKEEVWIPINNN